RSVVGDVLRTDAVDAHQRTIGGADDIRYRYLIGRAGEVPASGLPTTARQHSRSAQIGEHGEKEVTRDALRLGDVFRLGDLPGLQPGYLDEGPYRVINLGRDPHTGHSPPCRFAHRSARGPPRTAAPGQELKFADQLLTRAFLPVFDGRIPEPASAESAGTRIVRTITSTAHPIPAGVECEQSFRPQRKEFGRQRIPPGTTSPTSAGHHLISPRRTRPLGEGLTGIPLIAARNARSPRFGAIRDLRR